MKHLLALIQLELVLIKNEQEMKFEMNVIWNPAENDDNHVCYTLLFYISQFLML